MKRVMVFLIALVILLSGCADQAQTDNTGSETGGSTVMSGEEATLGTDLNSPEDISQSMPGDTNNGGSTNDSQPNNQGESQSGSNNDGSKSSSQPKSSSSQIDNKDWRSHPSDFKLIAFTFDDGPSDAVADGTPAAKIADVLQKNDGSGTFFFAGSRIEKVGNGIPSYVLGKSCEIANHSYLHKSFSALSTAEAHDEIYKPLDIFKQVTGVTPKYFRAAGFSQSEDMWKMLTELHTPAIGTYAPGFNDYSGGSGSKENIVNYLTKNALPDGIIIGMHSTNTKFITPDALEEALPILYAKGYRFCTVSELFEYKGIAYSDIPTTFYIRGVKSVANGKAEYYR